MKLTWPITEEEDSSLTNESPRLCPHLATVGYQNVNIATHTHLVLMILRGGLTASLPHSGHRMAQNILVSSESHCGGKEGGVTIFSGV